jgi:hypothetical protein
MELKKALELQVEHYGRDGTIRIDENGYICLNDLAEYYPHKRIQNWIDNASTKELIEKVGDVLISWKRSELKPVVAKRGKYKSGTYAHELVAMDFAAWLSVELKLKIYQAYIDGTQNKQDWNIKRILAANNYKLMCEAIKNDHETPKHYHFSNEALMLNEIVFGVRDGHVRESATEKQLEDISWAESRNGAFIEAGMDYQSRKAKLIEMYKSRSGIGNINTKELENGN